MVSKVLSGNTPYETYFTLPWEIIDDSQMLARGKHYADSNRNGIYDQEDRLIGGTVVKSYDTIGGQRGTFESSLGSNIVYSYIGDTLVGQATFEGGDPWGSSSIVPTQANDSSNRPTGVQPLTTTSSVDTLTGIKKKKDIFKFDADPSGQVDKIIGFNAKEKDILSISKSAFEIDRGTFAIAKNAKALAKQLGTNVDIVYYRKTGELILNTNGPDPGFGDDGGVFAVLTGRPTVGAGSVQFY
jgi:hypothetical protein